MQTRFLPDWRTPLCVAGFPAGRSLGADVVAVLSLLRASESEEFPAAEIDAACPALLRDVRGEDVQSFSSFFLGEALARFGPLADNPLLRGLDDEARARVAAMCDNSGTHAPLLRAGALAVNHWTVLVRAELAKRQLGIPSDPVFLAEGLAAIRRLVARNPLGFFDDSGDDAGRYDCYSADMTLFVEPIAAELGDGVWRRMIAAHAGLLDHLALRDGNFIAWGRSNGALGVCLTIETAALALAEGVPTSPRLPAVLARAFECLRKNWADADGLLTMWTHRRNEHYRGPGAWLPQTLDVWRKLLIAARQLRALGDRWLTEPAPDPDLPSRDLWIPFESDRPLGVWSFRRGPVEFQLPIVGGSEAFGDWPGLKAYYLPWLHGLLPAPTHAPLLVGAPQVRWKGPLFAACGVPTSVNKTPDALRVRWETFLPVAPPTTPAEAPAGARETLYRADAEGVTITEHLELPATGAPVHLLIPEPASGPAIRVALDGHASRHRTIDVEGISEWQSFWGPTRRVFEWEWDPAPRVDFTYRITLA